MRGKCFIEIHFTDLMGVLRSTTIVRDESILRSPQSIEVFFDASSVYGFEPIEHSDLMLRPIPGTIARIPWLRDVYRCIAGVYSPSGERYVKDPRLVAEKTVEYLSSLGYVAKMGVEVEFFLFNSVSYTVEPGKQELRVESIEAPGRTGLSIPLKRGYHLPEPFDSIAGVRRVITRAMEELGFSCVKEHHEVASYGQLEITSKALEPHSLGDFVQTIKYVARNIARMKGYTAVFLAKPVIGDNGNGMHVHISLWQGDRNIFYDPDMEGGLSQVGRYFIGGLLEHGRSLSALVSPTVNSYKRLIPGYEAPTILAWGFGNRSVAVRVPVVASEKMFRIEYRPPDPTSNPYLAFSAIVLAGVDGIRKKIEPGEPLGKNAYRVGSTRYRSLPRSLIEALDELETDNDYLKPVFPRELIETYIDVKRREAIEVSSTPSPIDYLQYMMI